MTSERHYEYTQLRTYNKLEVFVANINEWGAIGWRCMSAPTTENIEVVGQKQTVYKVWMERLVEN